MQIQWVYVHTKDQLKLPKQTHGRNSGNVRVPRQATGLSLVVLNGPSSCSIKGRSTDSSTLSLGQSIRTLVNSRQKKKSITECCKWNCRITTDGHGLLFLGAKAADS